MSICPMDFRPCVDDLCHGGGCIRSPYSEEMLARCADCGDAYEPGLADDGLCDSCGGEWDEYRDEDEEEYA